MHGCTFRQYIFRSCDTSAYNAVRFDENHFTCECKKKNRIAERFQISHCWWSFSSNIMAAKGLNLHLRGNKNRLQQRELIATAVENFCLRGDMCNSGAIGYLLWTPPPCFWTPPPCFCCCEKNDKTCFCILIFCHRNTKMKKAKDMFRIRVNILMALTTIVLCMVYMSSGKKAQERGESVIQMNRDRHFEFQQQK